MDNEYKFPFPDNYDDDGILKLDSSETEQPPYASSAPTTTSIPFGGDDDDDDEDVCRICRCEGTNDAPLYTPCRCSGSVARIHDRCLRQWLSMSNKETCELCHYRYRFSPVFAPDTPSTLPLSESIKVILQYILKTTLPRIFHIMLCIFVWLIVIPIVSSWIYRGWVHFPSLTTDTLALRLRYFQYRFQDWLTGIGIILFLIAAVFVNTFGGDALVKRSRELDLKATRYKEIMNKLYIYQEKQIGTLTKIEKRLEMEQHQRELILTDDNRSSDGNVSNVGRTSSSFSSSAATDTTTTPNDHESPLSPPPFPLPTGYVRPRSPRLSRSASIARIPSSSSSRNDETDDESILEETGTCQGFIARCLHYIGIPYTLGKILTVTLLCYVTISLLFFAMISEASTLYTYAQLFTLGYLCIECILTVRQHYKEFPTGWEEGTVRTVMNNEERQRTNLTVSGSWSSTPVPRRTETMEEKEYKIKKEVQKWRWATRMTLYNALRKKVRDSLIALVIIPLLLLRPSKWLIHGILRIDPFLPYRIAVGWPLTETTVVTMDAVTNGLNSSLIDSTDTRNASLQDTSTIPAFVSASFNATPTSVDNSTSSSSPSSIITSALSSFIAYLWNENDYIDSDTPVSIQNWLKLQNHHRFSHAVPVTDTATLTIAIFWYVWTGVLIITTSIFIGLMIVPEPRRNPHILLHKLQLQIQNVIQQVLPTPPPPPPPYAPIVPMPVSNEIAPAPLVSRSILTEPIVYSTTVSTATEETNTGRVNESLDHTFPLSSSVPNYTAEDNQDILLPGPLSINHTSIDSTTMDDNSNNNTDTNNEGNDDDWQIVQPRSSRRRHSIHPLSSTTTTTTTTTGNSDSNPSLLWSLPSSHHRTVPLPSPRTPVLPDVSTVTQPGNPSSSRYLSTSTNLAPINPAPLPTIHALPQPRFGIPGGLRRPRPPVDNDDDNGGGNRNRNDNNNDDDDDDDDIDDDDGDDDSSHDSASDNGNDNDHDNLPANGNDDNPANNINANNNPDDLQNFVWDDDADGGGLGNFGDEDDELGVPLGEILGLRPPLTNLLLYACVGSTLIFVGIGLFIAMPILSTRSGILFLRTRRWLSLVFDWNIFAWRSHPIVSEPVMSSNDALFLIKGYISMLGVLLFIGFVDELTRLFFRFYCSLRSTVIRTVYWLKYGSLAKQPSLCSRYFSMLIHTYPVPTRSNLSRRILVKKEWLAQRTLTKIEKYILPSPLRKYVTENWPARDIQGWLTSSTSVRSAVLLARLSALLILKIIIVPFLIGCTAAWAIQPVTSSLLSSATYVPTDINDTFLPSLSTGIQLIESRVSWLLHAPLSFLLAHWLLGVATLGITGALLMQLREAIRYEGLAQWTMSPNASNSNLRAIFEAPVSYHLLSSAIVLSIITFVFTFAVRIPAALMVSEGVTSPVSNGGAGWWWSSYDVTVQGTADATGRNSTVLKNGTESIRVSLPEAITTPESIDMDTLTFTKAYLAASLRGDYTRGTLTVLSANCVPVDMIHPGYRTHVSSTDNDTTSIAHPNSSTTLRFPPSCSSNRILAFRLFIHMEKSGGKGVPLSDALTAVEDDKTLPFSFGGMPGMASEMQRQYKRGKSSSSSVDSNVSHVSTIGKSNDNGTNDSSNIADDWMDWIIDHIIHWSIQLPTLVPKTTTVILYDLTESFVNMTLSTGTDTVHLLGDLIEYTFGTSSVYFDTETNPLFTPSEPYTLPATARSTEHEKDTNTTETGTMNTESATKDTLSSSSGISYLPANEAPFFNVTIYEGSREFELLAPLVWLALDTRKSILRTIIANSSADTNGTTDRTIVHELPEGLPSSLYTTQRIMPTNTTDEPSTPANASTEATIEYFFKIMPVFKFSSLSGQQAVHRILDETRTDAVTVPPQKGFIHSWRVRNHGAVYLQTDDGIVTTETNSSFSSFTKVTGSQYRVGAWEDIAPLSTVRNISRWFLPSYTGRRAIDSTSVWWVPVTDGPSPSFLPSSSSVDVSYPGLRIPTGFGTSPYDINQLSMTSNGTNNATGIGTLGLVTSGPFTGMRRCLNLNMSAQDYFSTKGRDWVTDGHTSKHGNHETVPVTSDTLTNGNGTLTNGSQNINATPSSVPSSSPADTVTVRVFHSYVIREDGIVIDCGPTPPPAETLASLLPPPSASLLLHFHPPPDTIVTHPDILEQATKNDDLVNRVPLLPPHTLRVKWDRYLPSFEYNSTEEENTNDGNRKVNLPFLTRFVRWGDRTIRWLTNRTVATFQYIETSMDPVIVESMRTVLSVVMDIVYGLVYFAYLYVTYGYAFLVRVSSYLTLALKTVLPFPLQIAYHYAPWLMPLDSLLILVSVLISVEVLKAFAWMMSTTWMGFIANVLNVTKQILPPKETIRVHVFTIPPTVSHPSLNPLPPTTGGSTTTTATTKDSNVPLYDEIEASRIGRKESKHLLDLTKGFTETRNHYTVTDENGTVYEKQVSSPYLYPLTAKVDMEFYRHVDSTPGVGKFRPPIGTWVQSIRQYRGGPIRRIDPAFPQDDRLGGGRNMGNNNPNNNNNHNLDQDIGIQLNNLNGLLDPDDGDILQNILNNNNNHPNPPNPNNDNRNNRNPPNHNAAPVPIIQAEPVPPGRRRQRGAGGVRIDRPRAAARAVQAPMDEALPPRRRGGGQGGPQLAPVRDENMIAIPLPENLPHPRHPSTATPSMGSSKFPRAAYIRAFIEWTQLNNVADALLYIAIAGGSRSSHLIHQLTTLSSNTNTQDLVEALQSITEEPPIHPPAPSGTVTIATSSSSLPSNARRIPRIWTEEIRQQFREISTYRDHLKRLWDKADARSKAALLHALKTVPKPSLSRRNAPTNTPNDETETVEDAHPEDGFDAPPADNHNNNDNDPQRTDLAGNASLAAILTAPLQEVVMGTAVPYGWEYGDDNETAKAQEELCVRFRVAYMGDGLATDIDPLHPPMDSILALNTLTARQQFLRHQAQQARLRLNTFLEGVYRDAIVNGDATRGAVGLKRNEMQIFGYDEEWWKFTDFVILPPPLALHPNTSWSRPRTSEYIGPSLPATLAFLVSMEMGTIQAHGYPSHGTVAISHSDCARGIGLVSPNAPLMIRKKPVTESVTERQMASPVVSTAAIATYQERCDSSTPTPSRTVKSVVLPDAPTLRVRPDPLSLLLQETLACEEAISEITPETLRQARIRYAEAAYDLDACTYNPGSLLDPERTRKHFETRGITIDTMTTKKKDERTDSVRNANHKDTVADRTDASTSQNRPIDQLLRMARLQAANERGMAGGAGTVNIQLVPNNVNNNNNNNIENDNENNNGGNPTAPAVHLQVQFVRSIDPVGSPRRPYQCRDHVLPFFSARQVLLPRVLTGRGVQMDEGVLAHVPELAHIARTLNETSSSTNAGIIGTSGGSLPSSSTFPERSPNAVQIPQKLWPDACIVCGGTTEEVGVYRSLYPVYVRKDRNGSSGDIQYSIYPGDSYLVSSAEKKSSSYVCDERCLNVLQRSASLRRLTTESIPSSTSPHQLVWAVPLRGKLLAPVAHTSKKSNVHGDNTTRTPCRTFTFSKLWSSLQSTRIVRWLNTLTIYSLRLPLFVALCFWFGWIITASSIGLATSTGRMLFRSSGIPSIFHHDPIAIIGGGYIFLFCIDVILIGYYAILSVISGLVRRYAMAVSRVAVLLEDGWNAGSNTHHYAAHHGTTNNSRSSTTATNAANVPSLHTSTPKVALAVSSTLRTLLDQAQPSKQPFTIDLFDLAIDGYERVLTSTGIMYLYYRLRHALLRNSLYYLAIPLWRHTSCVALDIGNVHHVPREMTIRRALASVQLAFGILILFPVLLGFLYSTLTDPITLLVNMIETIGKFGISLSLFSTATVSSFVTHVPYGPLLRNLVQPIYDSAWQTTTASSSLFQLWCTGALAVALIVELCFTGLFGDRSRTWIELLEWRFISAYTSRIWSWQIQPFLRKLMYVTGCIFTITVIFFSFYTYIYVIMDTENSTMVLTGSNSGSNGNSKHGAALFFLTMVQRSSQYTVMSVLFIIGIYRIYTLRYSNRTLLRWRQLWDNWTTELRKQKYQIATILQNYPAALRPRRS